MGDFVNRMLGVITMSLDLPLGLWPVSLVVLAVAGWSAAQLWKTRELRSKPVVVMLLASAIVFVGLPTFASFYWARSPNTTPQTQEVPTLLLGIAWWGYVLLLAALVAMSRRRRLLVAGLFLPFLWLNFGLFVVSTMAVSGLWM